jgi:hypothetical protein
MITNTIKKFAIIIQAILISIVLASIYGVLHDQITYSISPEYYTKFKYQQFGFDHSWFGGHRQTVAIIGCWATWWTGIYIGLGLGVAGLVHPNSTNMFAAFKKALYLVMGITVLFGVFGFFYGWLHLTKTGVNWWMPEDLVDVRSFIIVGSIHNFSYIGGAVGLMAGIIYIIWRRKKERLLTPNKFRPLSAY